MENENFPIGVEKNFSNFLFLVRISLSSFLLFKFETAVKNMFNTHNFYIHIFQLIHYYYPFSTIHCKYNFYFSLSTFSTNTALQNLRCQNIISEYRGKILVSKNLIPLIMNFLFFLLFVRDSLLYLFFIFYFLNHIVLF